ncbi:hypothetical protein HT031_001687 [Scenedesmus sp. PABB004]|nr:hypothetical protein HT031_001687 [Scenedesmus sp. PABB004]
MDGPPLEPLPFWPVTALGGGFPPSVEALLMCPADAQPGGGGECGECDGDRALAGALARLPPELLPAVLGHLDGGACRALAMTNRFLRAAALRHELGKGCFASVLTAARRLAQLAAEPDAVVHPLLPAPGAGAKLRVRRPARSARRACAVRPPPPPPPSRARPTHRGGGGAAAAWQVNAKVTQGHASAVQLHAVESSPTQERFVEEQLAMCLAQAARDAARLPAAYAGLDPRDATAALLRRLPCALGAPGSVEVSLWVSIEAPSAAAAEPLQASLLGGGLVGCLAKVLPPHSDATIDLRWRAATENFTSSLPKLSVYVRGARPAALLPCDLRAQALRGVGGGDGGGGGA